jgi:HlyD family secretion protein
MKSKDVMTFFVVAAVTAALAVIGASVVTGNANPPEYRTAKVTQGDIADVVSATGTLNPATVITVGTQVSGQVSKLNVKLNEEVKAGQLLGEIDPTLLLAQIKQDRTTLETAKSNYEQAGRDLARTRKLLAMDYVAKVDLEHADQAYLTAKNSYDGASTVVERDEANLNYTKIVSPIDGVVIDKQVDLGQTLAASLQAPTLFKIAGDLTQMKINVNLPEASISKVKEGMPVSFTVDAFPGREFSGAVTVVNLNPNNQAGGVTYSVEVAVKNPGRQLLPGMTAYVTLTVSMRQGVLRVPASALRFTPPPEHISGLQRLFGKRAEPIVAPSVGKDAKTVYSLRDGHPVPVSVKTGASDDEYTEVSGEGFAEGDTVILGMLAGKR